MHRLLIVSALAVCGCGGKVFPAAEADGGGSCSGACTSGGWPLDGPCVPTAIDPALLPQSSEIDQALSAWSSQSCSRLCFSPPTISPTSTLAPVSATTDPCSRRLTFTPVPAGYEGLHYQVLLDDTRREIVSALVYVSASDTVADVTGYVGGILLLPGTGSAGAAVVDTRGQIVPGATAQFCQLYGRQATCQ